MAKRLRIQLDPAVHEALIRKTGSRGRSRFIEDLLRSAVFTSDREAALGIVDDAVLDAGYRAMAADEDRERESSLNTPDPTPPLGYNFRSCS